MDEIRVCDADAFGVDFESAEYSHGESGTPVVPLWLKLGREAIAASGSVAAAIATTPDLHVEIVLAHLFDDASIGDAARERVCALAEQIEEVRHV